MSEKSYVTMEQKKCIVCCKDYSTDALLLDQRLRERFNRYTVTGWGYCPACQKIYQGMVVMIEIDPGKSMSTDGYVKPSDAWRTGRLMGIKRDAAERLISGVELQEVMFIDIETFDYIEGLVPK